MLRIGSAVRVHSPFGSWDGEIVGTDWMWDSACGAVRKLFLVSYGRAGGSFEFYQQADNRGRRCQPDRADHWMEVKR